MTPLSFKSAVHLLSICGSGAAPWRAHHAERIKDLASVQGMRTNQLIGYGLVMGLDGTGDQTIQTPFTIQTLNSMLMQMGINVPPGTNMRLRNVAAVMVTAVLPSFAQPGQIIDVTVSRWAMPEACAAAHC